MNLIPRLLILGFACLSVVCVAAEKAPWQLAQETEVWEPVPAKVSINQQGIPSDAIVLFDGSGLTAWESVNGGEAPWNIKDGVLEVKPKTGDIRTRQSFCDVQLHIEWQAPPEELMEGPEGQGRGNSGVFFQERYEVQVLDSYGGTTYVNGQAASIYKQHIPLVNATKPLSEWNVYDIIFTAPKFTASGEVKSPAYITVLHNGVLVQNHAEVQGPTAWIGHPPYKAHGCAPLRLQDHGNPTRFKNIWLRAL